MTAGEVGQVADAGETAASAGVALNLRSGQAIDLAAMSLSLARRFAAGATLWCWSPRWPEHAAHVAVEFVHPVIMGKRALPAAVVDDPDPIAALRTLVSPGDVLLAIAPGHDVTVISAMSRAHVWGVETIWIGTGNQPAVGVVDHSLFFQEADGEAASSGAFALVYHVLWELTHVCFEHPGLVRPPAAETDDDRGPDASCVTCRDEGRIGEVMGGVGRRGTVVRTASGVEEIDTTLVDPVASGDLVVIHAGIAISQFGGET